MKRILVIEDDPEQQTVIGSALNRSGYEVLSAFDGAAGLALARAELPDLVITDVEMPRMNGNAVLKALRGDSTTATIPCILMTSRPDITSMRLGMFLGADDYLPKPFPIADLLAAVKGRLQRSDQMRSLAESNAARCKTGLGKTLPHELLTPLSGVLGLAQLLKSDCEFLKPAEVFELASLIEQSGDRLLRLTHNHLLLMELELIAADSAHAQSLPHGGVRASRNTIIAAAEACALKSDRSSDLVLDLEEGPVPIREMWFRKLVEELIDNAFKFSVKGTSIRVVTSSDPIAFVFSVIDQGRGMTSDQIAQIGPYQQFDRKRHEQQGLGLGLAIAKRMTEMHGGSFAVHSRVSSGTTVEIRLPIPLPNQG